MSRLRYVPRTTPNITAFVVPLVVLSGNCNVARSRCPSFLPCDNFTSRTSSVNVCSAVCEFGRPGRTRPATLPPWQAKQFMVQVPFAATT